MAELPKGNAVIGQSGGPTAVINQSLVGVIEGLRSGLQRAGSINQVFGMRHGVRGLTKGIEKGKKPADGDLYDFTEANAEWLERLAVTPAAALGSTRDKPDADYGQRIMQACRHHDIRYFFYIGGNDSSETCRIVQEAAAAGGYDMRCFHVPKTVDNDLVENDHCPGYPSAARYVALAFMADGQDNASLPGIKINVVMGRNAGFLTAASALARRAPAQAPHLIYLPETPFDTDRFIADVEELYAKLGRCHVAVSEGIRNKEGKEIGPTLMKDVQRDAHGNVQLSGSSALGDALADLVKQKLTPAGGGGKPPRVRADTLGYLQRCWPDPSPIDSQEARMVGRHAAGLAEADRRGGSITITREAQTVAGKYSSSFGCVELSAVAAKTRKMPADFIRGHNDVTPAFIDYCLPLVGDLPRFERL